MHQFHLQLYKFTDNAPVGRLLANMLQDNANGAMVGIEGF